VITPSTEIIEESNYYPFGLKHKGYNNVVNSLGNSTAQKFGYNGKELNEELGLNMIDFGWRNYDASLGKWFNIDPFAEKYYQVSPYNYVANSPIIATDPDGRDIRISTAVDDDGNVTINITLTGKIIDLSSSNINTKAYASNLSARLGKLFSGKHKRENGSNVSVNFTADITVAESTDDIGEDDHVFGIVDSLEKYEKKDGTSSDPAGKAQVGGNITLIEASYRNRSGVGEHETGHLMGLGHTEGTFMHPKAGNRKVVTQKQRRKLYETMSVIRGSRTYRNANFDDLGEDDSKDQLKNALYDWKAKYNLKKYYK
ncbi:RHS repeat domain-containing protein, partial [Tenacibaculum maritimum]|uniref:RHS repeat domain-containing protein n=1 Tax=Tenacibaculum maritimum TaxID=107401 RepID=UPI0019159000